MASNVLFRAVRLTLSAAACGVAASPILMTTGVAQAQDSVSALEEIVVTARKREETLLETPLSIQAFSADDIQAANLRSLEDVAAFSAGMNFEKVGNSQAGRYNSVIRFRGLEMLVTNPTTQTGALFVDGVRIMGGAASFTFNDVERIEVIRGPQAAYFGRGTFGGAINYVTAEPSSEVSGRVSGEYSPTFGSNAYSAMIQGALTDTLSARLSATSQTRGAAFTAADGGKLGKERTDQLNVMLLWRPTDDLKVKLNYVYGEDNDGPASTTFIPFRTHGNCPAGTQMTVKTTAGMHTGPLGVDFHCGALPRVPVSNNSQFYTIQTPNGPVNARDILVDTSRTLDLPPTGTPHLDHFGLKSIFHLYSLNASYELSDSLTLGALVGYNKRSSTQIRDDDNYDSPGRIIKGWLDLEALSAELRLNYDAGGRWRGLIGAGYTLQKQEGDLDGGIQVSTNIYGQPVVGLGSGTVDNQEVTNRGVFGSIEFDAFDWLTLTFEGRYQIDQLQAEAGQFPGPYVKAPKEEYKDFLPRILATFKPYDGGTFYASYSEGVLPGTVNAIFDTLTPNERAVLEDQVPGAKNTLPSQTLDAYEIGWKQQLSSLDAWFSLAAFYMEWSNIPASAQVSFLSPDTNRLISTSVSVAGDAEVKGFELELQWLPVEQLDLRASVGYADATYTDFQSSRYNRLFGVPAGASYKADGNRVPRVPRETAAVSGTWTSDLTTDWEWYLRGDVLYSGKAYTDETELQYVSSYTTVNARIGVTRLSDDYKVELFCTNCFDKNGWRTGRRGTDFGDTSPIANNLGFWGTVVQPIQPREIGVRMVYEF